MKSRLITTLAALAWALHGLSSTAAEPPAIAPHPSKDVSSKDVFGLARLHSYHLELSAKEWATLQDVTGGMRFGPPGGPPPQPPEKKLDTSVERHKSLGFGMEFPWAHATFSEDGKTYKDVGLRYKGNGSYMGTTRSLKRNLKVDLDHYDEDLRYYGLKTINLNADSMDGTRSKEALSFALFRAAGVPAPRTAFAQVTLTVAGKYDKELLGLYTVVEQVDRAFLKEHFKNYKGMLLKPERLRGLEYLGDDWNSYKERYQPKHTPTKDEAKRFIEFAKLVNKGDDEQFRKEIGSYLDIDEFLRFLAVNGFLVNLDSFLGVGHNYYIYLNPQTNKFVFIPWDLDLSFGGFPMGGGTPEQQMDLSMKHPHSGQNKLIDRLLAIKEVDAQYQKLLKELAVTCFTKERLVKDLDLIEKTIKEPLAKEIAAVKARKEPQGGFGPMGGMFGKPIDLHTFIDKRIASVANQLAGKSKGFVSTGFGFGPPGGPGGFGLGNFMAKPILEALDTNKDDSLTPDELKAGIKKFFAESDTEKKGKLDEKALAAGLTRIWPMPPGFGPRPGGPGGPPPGGPGRPGGPPGGFGPGGFNPGTFVASGIMRRADPDKKGTVTLDQLLKTADTLFSEVDKEKKGKLDEKTLATAINLLTAPPPGAGPPGGPLPQPKPPEDKKP